MNKKTEQLGMSIGTASNRLRKLVMFMLVKKCDLNQCHQCGNEILSAEELSIEHVQPWLDSNPELFWDLGNISFSHLSCNIGAARRKRVSREHKLASKARRMRERYTTENRRQKKLLTGW